MKPSVTDAISNAIKRTKTILFNPFDITKWLAIGFCAWLAQLGEGSGSSGNWGSGNSSQRYSHASNWFMENLALIGIIVLFIVLLVFTLGILFTWLRSRGQFMLLDCVAKNRGAIKEPWKEYAPQANSLFVFYLIIFFIFMGVLLLTLGISAGIAWPDLKAEQFGSQAITALILMGFVLIPVILVMTLIESVTKDFITPVMYMRRLTVTKAWRTVRDELFQPFLGSVIVFYIIKIALSIAIGIALLMLIFMTCCILAIPLMIPYINVVILLPLFVFWRCYSLCFMQLASPALDVFPAEASLEEDPLDSYEV